MNLSYGSDLVENQNEKKENPYSNLLKGFSQRSNASFYFSRFLDRVKENKVREDGTDELLNLIDKYVIDGHQFYRTIKAGTVLYRARIIDSEKIKASLGLKVSTDGKLSGYDESNSREAPLGYSAEGRNNISGVSYLYLASDAETACAEVKPTVRQLVSLAEFIIKRQVQIIDFSDEKVFESKSSDDESISLGSLFAKIMLQYFVPVVDSAEYRATQIITDHIRKTGIDGVAYKSFYNERGTNYTIFNSDRNRFEFIGSRIVMLQSERRTFLDFNNNNVFNAKTMGYASYNHKDADEMIEKIRVELSRSY